MFVVFIALAFVALSQSIPASIVEEHELSDPLNQPYFVCRIECDEGAHEA